LLIAGIDGGSALNRGMAIMKGIRECGTNGNDGKNGIPLGFPVCSIISVCSVFSLKLGIANHG
jgi:hypothetical protein